MPKGYRASASQETRTLVGQYRRMTNMSARDLKRWKKSDAFKEYRRRSSGDPVEAVNRNIRLQRRIQNDAITDADQDDLQKAVSFLSRAKNDGKGERIIGSGRTAVSKNTAALRSWAFDPTGRFT